MNSQISGDTKVHEQRMILRPSALLIHLVMMVRTRRPTLSRNHIPPLDNTAVSQPPPTNTSIRLLHLTHNTLHRRGLSRNMEHLRPTHTLQPRHTHNHSLGMNTQLSSRSNMLAQMVIRIMSHLQLPRLDPPTTMDNHPTIPPVSPPLILHHGTHLPLPPIHNPIHHPHHLIPNHTSSTINSPTQTPAQVTTTNHPIRLTLRLNPLALPPQPPLDTQTNRTPAPLTNKPIHDTNSPHTLPHLLEGTTSPHLRPPSTQPLALTTNGPWPLPYLHGTTLIPYLQLASTGSSNSHRSANTHRPANTRLLRRRPHLTRHRQWLGIRTYQAEGEGRTR